MSSFLERLKKKDVIPSTPDDAKKAQIDAQNKPAPAPDAAVTAEQLKVDILQSPSAIIIYAQLAGASVNDYSVTIEGDGDIITIKGERKRPGVELFGDPAADGKEHVLEECLWGKFYRQIILPAEIDAEKTQAKMREGVLMLLLPLKTASSRGVKITVTSV